MKYLILLVAVLIVAACGSSKTATQVISTPQYKQAEAIVKACVAKTPHIKGLVHCIAPQGHSAVLENCILGTAHTFIHRSQWEKEVATCVENNR